MKTLLILGNITFKEDEAIIHEIDNAMLLDNIDIATEIGELLCNTHGAYIIPQAYEGEIRFD
jgi:hypothetical protein